MSIGRYGSRTVNNTQAKYRQFAIGEIEEALAYYKTEGIMGRTIPIWKDRHGNQYSLIQITDSHLANLIPFLQKQAFPTKRSFDMLHMMQVEQKRRVHGEAIDTVRERMQTQLEL